MTTQWQAEFGDDYAIPAALDALAAAGELIDISWHNDVRSKPAMTGHAISDQQVKAIYAKLIGLSFENNGHDFEPYQRAWNEVKVILGVSDVTGNGHGQVIWRSGHTAPAPVASHD